MRDSVETKTSSFKGEKTQKAMIDFDTPVHEARRRESDNWLLQKSPRHNSIYKSDSEF